MRNSYWGVLSERPIRRMLIASLAGRIGFLMLPLGMIFLVGSAGTAGALVAAFSVASALAPARGRLVDRYGPRALTAFALACAIATWSLVLASEAGAPAAVEVALGGLVGLLVPPLGPFTRAAFGRVLRERQARLQRAYGLDSAGEEAALIFAPLLVALLAGLASSALALMIAAAAMLAGTAAVARTSIADAGVRTAAAARATPLPGALWLLFAALVPMAAALGAIEIAVPASASAHGNMSTAGLLLSGMAIATVAGSLLAGRRTWRGPPERRVVALLALMAAGLAATAAVEERLGLLALALLIPGAALGALFATVYVVVGRLAPCGSGTRTFAWLVTANNGGLALGAAAAGALTEGSGAAAGLWFGAGCTLAGIFPASAAAVMSMRVLKRATMPDTP